MGYRNWLAVLAEGWWLCPLGAQDECFPPTRGALPAGASLPTPLQSSSKQAQDVKGQLNVMGTFRVQMLAARDGVWENVKIRQPLGIWA